MSTSGSDPVDVILGELVLLDGQRQSDAAHMAHWTAPRRARRDRRSETLLVFLDLGGGGASGLARAMLEHFCKTFWRSSGPVTSAVRHAINAANDHLRQENRLMPVSHRRRAGLVCSVLQGDTIYLAQIGPAHALLWHGGHAIRFPAEPGERLPLGVSSGLDMQFTYGSFGVGDRLLLTGESWTAGVSDDTYIDALSAVRLEKVMRTLERRAGAYPFSALIIQRGTLKVSPTSDSVATERALPPVAVLRTPELASPEPLAPKFGPVTDLEPAFETEVASGRSEVPASTRTPAGAARAEYADSSVHLEDDWHPSKPLVGFAFSTDQLHRSGRGLRRFGQSIRAGINGLFKRVLPEPSATPDSRMQHARASSRDSVVMMAGIAVAIPLLIAFAVVTFYLQRSQMEQRTALVNQALALSTAARQTVGDDARDRWVAALEAVDAALAVAPADQEVLSLQAEGLAVLDRLDRVVRPELISFWDYGPGESRRVAATRMQVYVLDGSQNQVIQHSLDRTQRNVTGDPAALVAYQGQSVGDTEIGELHDVIWLPADGAWATDAVLILTGDNQLLQHNLSWGVSWLPFDVGGKSDPIRILRPYGGRLYALYPEENRISRFFYSSDGFGTPEDYFTVPPSDLSRSIDMAVDGAVWVLTADGTVHKFFGGEEQPFVISGLPRELSRPVALVSEGDADTGALYIADAGSRAILALSKDGNYLFQVKAHDDAFAELEALAVEPDSRTLYLLAGGQLYALALPPLP